MKRTSLQYQLFQMANRVYNEVEITAKRCCSPNHYQPTKYNYHELQSEFWKYKENSYLDNHKVYETLCDEGNIEGLENVPVDEIREKIAKAFSDWNKVDENSFENSNKGAFQITTTSQSVMIDCYGMDGEDMNKFIDILFEYGCPLYDPQVGERYDDND